MRVPRDLLDEIDLELRAVSSSRRRQSDRLLLLEELRAVALAAAQHLDRPMTARDLIALAPDALERERRRGLVQALRTSETSRTGSHN